MNEKNMPLFPVSVLNPASTQFSFNIGEGEKDDELYRYFVKTNCIDNIIKNIKRYSFVIAPKGVGKSALCNIITDCKKNILKYSDKHFFLNAKNFIETIENCDDKKNLKYNIVKHILSSIAGHLSDYYLDMGYELESMRRIFSIGVKCSAQELIKTEIDVGILKGSLQKNYKYSDNLSNNCGEMIRSIERVLTLKNRKVLICIDNVDDILRRVNVDDKKTIMTAFYDAIQYIGKHNSSLIIPVLFVRNDLYRLIDTTGEIDKSAFSKVELTWEKSEFLELILKRFLNSDELIKIKNRLHNDSLSLKRKICEILNVRRTILYKQMSFNQLLCIFHIFFPFEICLREYYDYKMVNFVDWLYNIFCDLNNTLNIRTSICFFKFLFEKQYQYFKSKKIEYIKFSNGSYSVISEESILCAFEELQKQKILDYADLVTINGIEMYAKIRLLKNIIYELDKNKNKSLKDIEPREYGFSKDEYMYFLDELEFHGCIKQKLGETPYTQYYLANIFKGYSKTYESEKIYHTNKDDIVI